MSDFKVGDIVISCSGAYSGYPAGSRYNIPKIPLEVCKACNGYIVLMIPGIGMSPPLYPACFTLYNPPKTTKPKIQARIARGGYLLFIFNHEDKTAVFCMLEQRYNVSTGKSKMKVVDYDFATQLVDFEDSLQDDD